MIVFLHGYGSSGEKSSTGKSVKEIFPHTEVMCFTYDYQNPLRSAQEILQQLADINQQDVELIVGVSLGGFWARWLANQISVPLFLINPSLNPAVSLKKRNDFNPDFLTHFDKYSVEQDDPELPITVLLGTQDTVIDPVTAATVYLGRARVVMVSGGHQLTLEQMKKTMIEAYNCPVI